MKQGRLKLLALCIATFMLLLDITIVQAALPRIQHELGGSITSLQWTIDAYTLALASLIISFGAVADRVGRRAVFLAGVAGFSLGSLACALSTSMVMLDVSRAVQGIGGSAMFATTLALIGQEFAGPARGRAVLAWGTTVGAAVASGPLLGGLLTEYATWQWIFIVNVPLGAVTIALTLRFVGEGRDSTGRRVDVAGLLSLTAGLVLFIGGLLRGSASDWNSTPAWWSLGVGVAMLAGFAMLQTRPGAMLDRTLLANRSFRGVSLATVALGAGMFSAFLYVTIYLQGALGLSPAASGLRLLAATVPVMVVPALMHRRGVSPVSGRLIGSGLGLIAAGLLTMAVMSSRTSSLGILPGLVIAGVGIGLASTCVAATALAVVAPARSGLAAGISNTCRLGGIAVGVAVLGVAQRTGIAESLHGVDESVRSWVAIGSLHDAMARLGGGLAQAQSAFASGLQSVLVTAAVISLAGSLVAFRSIRPGVPGHTGSHATAKGPSEQPDTVPSVARG